MMNNQKKELHEIRAWTSLRQTSIEIAEAIFELAKHDLVTKANERGHSTTVQAAYIAQQSDAKQLIITHISPRYSLSDSDAMSTSFS